MRRAAQDRAEIVRIADAVQPQQQRRRIVRKPGEQCIQGDRGRHAQIETDPFVMAAASQALQIVLLDDAIADAMLDAPRQHRLEHQNILFDQPDLAQILRSMRECRAAGIDAVQALFRLPRHMHSIVTDMRQTFVRRFRVSHITGSPAWRTRPAWIVITHRATPA